MRRYLIVFAVWAATFTAVCVISLEPGSAHASRGFATGTSRMYRGVPSHPRDPGWHWHPSAKPRIAKVPGVKRIPGGAGGAETIEPEHHMGCDISLVLHKGDRPAPCLPEELYPID